MIGYFSQAKKDVPATTQASAQGTTRCEEQGSPVASETDPAPIMNWSLVKSSLAGKISPGTLESMFR